MSARYGREVYEKSPLDTDRYRGELRLIRQSDEHTTIYRGTHEHVELDDSAATPNDYDLNEALAAYRTRTQRGPGNRSRLWQGRWQWRFAGRPDRADSVMAKGFVVLVSRDQSAPGIFHECVAFPWRFRAVGRHRGQQIRVGPIRSLPRQAREHPLVVRIPKNRIECGAQTGDEDHSNGANVNRTLTGFNCNVGRKLTPTAVLPMSGGWTSDDVDGAT